MYQSKGFIGYARGWAWYIPKNKRGVWRLQGRNIRRPSTELEDRAFAAYSASVGWTRAQRLNLIEAWSAAQPAPQTEPTVEVQPATEAQPAPAPPHAPKPKSKKR